MNTPRIYVACLAAYNNGRLHGRWIEANQTVEDISSDVDAMLAASPEPGAEEWAIHDYEGFGELRLREWESFERVSAIAAGIDEHGDAFAAWLSYDTSKDPSKVDRFEEMYRGEWDSLRYYADQLARAFHGAERLPDVAAAIARHASSTDVYIGVLPRRRQASRRDDLMRAGRVLWADCDAAESAAAVTEFMPRPAITLASGSGANRHTYWLLRDAVPTDVIETANRRLAWLLGSDLASADATRILRPPSLNHKHDPPTPVRLLRCEPSERQRLAEIVGVIDHDVALAARHSTRTIDASRDDPLLNIDPVYYVERLAGLAVGRDATIRCPFHEDHTPSLRVFRDPARGWYCFGCRRGGSIYDFASQLWQIGTRGSDFNLLRARLTQLMGR
jgi:antirestriction protein